MFPINPDKKFVAPFDELMTHFATVYAMAKALKMSPSSVYPYATGKIKIGSIVAARANDLLESLKNPQPENVGTTGDNARLIIRVGELAWKVADLEARLKALESFC